MKAILIALVLLAIIWPENRIEIWHTWSDGQVAILEEVAQ